MTGKADFTEQEWELVREGPAAAGMYALMASKGGSFRETWALAKTYAEARKSVGESELPRRPRRRKAAGQALHSAEQLEQEGLTKLSQAVGAPRAEDGPGRGRGLPSFVLEVAGSVAKAHKEEGEAVSPEEREAIEKITTSLHPGGAESSRLGRSMPILWLIGAFMRPAHLSPSRASRARVGKEES